MATAGNWISDRLEATSQWWWLFSFLCRVILTATAGIFMFLLAVGIDTLWALSPAGLTTVLVVWAFASLALIVQLVRWSLNGPRSIEATARRVEQAYPEFGNDLINAVQFLESHEARRSPFGIAFIERVTRRARHARFQLAPSKLSRWQRLRWSLQTPRDLAEACLVLCMVLLIWVACATFVPRWGSATERLFRPWADLPVVGSVKILEVTPGDCRILPGTDVAIEAVIEQSPNEPLRATLVQRHESGRVARTKLYGDASGVRYSTSLAAVTRPLSYRVEIGDSQSPWYHVRLTTKPTVQAVEVTYDYPAYLGRDSESAVQPHGDLDAPQFSVARLRITASKPIASGHVVWNGEKIDGRVEDDGDTLAVRLFLDRNAVYTIHLLDRDGHTDESPRKNRVHVIPDEPPSVRLIEPPDAAEVSPRQPLDVAISAADDYGLVQVRLERRDADGKTAIIKKWTRFPSRQEATIGESLAAALLNVQPGESILIRAVAVDGRQARSAGRVYGPQATATPWRRVTCVSAEAQAGQQLESWNSLQSQLWQLLKWQLEARRVTASVASTSDAEQAVPMAKTVHDHQVNIQQTATRLVQTLRPRDDRQRQVRQVLGELAVGPMLRAVELADRLQEADRAASRSDVVTDLVGEQDEVIRVLQSLLDTARLAAAEVLSEMSERPGGDLPDDVQEKLRDLKDKLDEFLKAQKKVIEATKELAKMPVEDFTEKEEQLLKDLAAIEDEWSRFLEDLHSDLSKLPEQDFANPSLLQELVEIQTELKMAEGALTKKTADIAVPLEQLGAERAEELVSNIEKWLPDTPDRERWSQEEPLTDEMKDAPMAELPGELEDLIGELMEEEEDLFDEMEDVSSSWADSLDKGAGWDAADGPISNMSAKGVTGNRLPNNSEIGGRSGEGRQGKSSGEFVGDTAVGKGGRRTPSRLTPDPQVKGQIKDVSKDPVGGATGGGKESGQGGEGLEGPVPPNRDRELQRLAKKQAALRNKAESIDLKFEVANFHHMDLRKLIEQMNAIESDLRAGRYQDALRRRPVLLEAMEAIKVYVGGQFRIRRDSSLSVPKDIQKEILDGMQEASPPGWEELNRAYFESLSTGQSRPPTGAKE